MVLKELGFVKEGLLESRKDGGADEGRMWFDGSWCEDRNGTFS